MTDRITFAADVKADGRRLRGSVALVGSRTWRNGEWLEVDPAAVVKADASGAIATWEHDDDKVLAAMGNGTLRLTRTDQGIEYETGDLPNTTYANDALELVRGGYVTGTSFEIEGLRSTFTTDPDGTRVRHITSIQKFRAVNPVRDPAFTNSLTAAFSKESDMTAPATPEVEPPVEPPVKPPVTAAPAAEPPVKPKRARFTSDESLYDTSATYAKELDAERISAAIEGFWAEANGAPDDIAMERIQAFEDVLAERTAADNASATRKRTLEFQRKMRRGELPKAPSGDAEMFQSDDYKAAFGRYLRTGDERLMEQFAQSVAGDGTQGGYTVPDTFLNRVTQSMKYYGGVADVADEIITTTGDTIHWPSINDTGNTAAIAAEGAAVAAAGADVVFGEIALHAFEYDATGTGNNPIAVSLVLLQDSAIDIESRLSTLLSQRIGRKQGADFATGAGTTEPLGLFTKTPDAMTATAVSMALPEHVLQVDQAYRDQGNCGWLLSDATLLKVWQSQSTTNIPLIAPGNISGAPAQLLWGYQYRIDNAAGTKVAFGDFRAGYIVRRVRSVELLVDPYTLRKSRQVAYHAWARADANIQDTLAYSVSEWSGVSADT